MAMLANHYASYFSTGQPPVRRGSAGPGMVPYQAFRAEDDWMVVASFTERMWRGVCQAVDRPELADDPRYVDARARFQNREELVALLNDIFAVRPASYWEERLRKQGVPFTRVNTLDRVVEDEQVSARRMIATLEHAEAGPIRLVDLPVKLSATPGRMRMAPPVLGQHTTEVLRELGFNEASIADLALERIVQDAALPATEGTRESGKAALK
jgi:crotonobetainyl-CoA:carnitine CoA-transferase CaiB-like acyl-CoA transferase